MKKPLIIIIAGIFVAFFAYGAFQVLMPIPVEDSFEVEIPKGATFRQAVDIMSRDNVIRDRNLCLFIGRISGIDRKIRAGYYRLHGSMNLLDLFRALKNGQIIEYDITIVEGDSLMEIALKLSEKNIIMEEQFHKLALDKRLLASHSITAPSVEGYLFPDTYKIPKGMDPEEALGMMINRLRDQYAVELRARAAEIGMSEREVLTLASIIEKEAATDEERPLISAVYHNRLRKKMPLQADPTSVYGIKSFGEKITLADLKRKTPYNTYLIRGLPPGPISSAGIKSIHAALYPANVPYIYFVSNNDGTHSFSVTAAEHEAAVRAYRKKKQTAGKQKENAWNPRE